MSREVDILLIEDNQADVTLTLRAMGEEIMTDRVRVARDGEEALDFLFRRGSYSGQAGIPRLRLILLDLKTRESQWIGSACRNEERSTIEDHPHCRT